MATDSFFCELLYDMKSSVDLFISVQKFLYKNICIKVYKIILVNGPIQSFETLSPSLFARFPFRNGLNNTKKRHIASFYQMYI